MYTASITRTEPGCIVFLLDQSGSMDQPFGAARGMSLAEGAARAINKVLYDLCLRAQKEPGAPPRHYFDVGVFGYGGRHHGPVQSAFTGPLAGRPLVSLTELAMNPLAIREIQETADVPPARKPVWFEPVAGYATPMCEAIATAGSHLYDWVQEHPHSFPPIVINVTDGVVTDDGYQGATLDEWARRLTTLTTNDGSALLFNIFLSSTSAPVSYFPTTGQHLPVPGPSLFAISSELPEPIARNAKLEDLPLAPDARGLVFNADMAALSMFLEIGTRYSGGVSADR